MPAYCPDLLARFCKEASLSKQEMLPDVGKLSFFVCRSLCFVCSKNPCAFPDHMDIGARQENLAVRGEPIMLQMCVVPAYALTIHKASFFLIFSLPDFVGHDQ